MVCSMMCNWGCGCNGIGRSIFAGHSRHSLLMCDSGFVVLSASLSAAAGGDGAADNMSFRKLRRQRTRSDSQEILHCIVVIIAVFIMIIVIAAIYPITKMSGWFFCIDRGKLL